MDKIKNIIIAAALLAGVWLIGFSCGKRHFREVREMPTDTLIVVDTHVIEKPVLVERTSKETLLVAVHDTTIINDTIYVPIPIEKKIYKGEDYLAEISGYKASLDRIEVYPKTTTITKMQTKINRNSLALGAELQYYGTTYIPIYLEYSHLLHKNIQISAKLLYDFPSKQIGVGMGMQFQIGW